MNYNSLKWLLLLVSIGYSIIGLAQKKELKTLHAMQYKIYLDDDPSKVKKLLFKPKMQKLGLKERIKIIYLLLLLKVGNKEKISNMNFIK